jgi:sec-independent protein translocase protein TatA
MNVFGIGLPEMVLIMVVALLVFGPKKLPEIGRSMGKAIRSFQDASKEFEAEFKREAEQQPETTPDRPMTATLEPPSPPSLQAADRAPMHPTAETTGQIPEPRSAQGFAQSEAQSVTQSNESAST